MAQNLIAQYWNGSAWVDFVLLSEPGVTITRGSDGESGSRPAKFEVTLNNDDGRYRTSDPMSPLYGIAGRNTRVRVRVDGTTRTQAEAAAWRPGKTPEHVTGTRGLAWCDLTAEGLLRRILQWETPLRSPVFRAVSRFTTLLGYWSMEGKSDGTQLTNAARNGRPGTAVAAQLGAATGPGGSDDVVEIGTGTVLSGIFPTTSSSTAGWQISFTVKLAAIPTPIGYLPLLQWWTSNGNMWTFDTDDSSFRVTVRTSDGTILLTSPIGWGTGASPNQWIVYRVKVSQVGGNVQVEPAWYTEGAGFVYGFTTSYAAASMGRLARWRSSQNLHNLGAGIGHVFGVTGVADNLQSYEMIRSFDGFPGETAAARFFRLMDEEGLARYLTGVAADTAPMGPQRSGTLKSHLKEIIATEDAVIVDEWSDIALRMFSRRVLYNQPVALALTYPDHIAPTIEEVTDDLGIANLVTVTNSRGGEYTASLDSGPVSTLPPPAGVGEAKSTYDVNVADESIQLQQTAEWYLGKGTIDRARYPKIKIDLLAHPELVADAYATDISDRITITGLESRTVDLIVVGFVEKVGHDTRTIEFTCLPADVQHNIGVYDAVTSRYDSASTTLAGAVGIGVTAVPLTTVERLDCWSTTETPYVCTVAGERMTVTAMTAPAGAGPYTQTATVTRTLAKAHVAGAPFRLADPVYVGL